MAIKYYARGEHPAGFIGFRVTAGFGGKYYQKYFGTGKAGRQDDGDPRYLFQRLSAELQDAKWKADGLAYRYRTFVTSDHPNTLPYRGVGVHSITAGFFGEKSTWQAGFAVNRPQQPGQRPRGAKYFTFNNLPYSQAWDSAVRLWSELYDIAEIDTQRVLSNAPPPEQFKELRRQMNQEGFSIPVSALSSVFREQREIIAHERALAKAKQMKLDKVGGIAIKEQIQAEVTAWFEQYQRQQE